MTKKLSILVLMTIATAFMAFYVGQPVAAGSGQQNNAGDSHQNLNARISELETQVAALQKQVKGLESKVSSRVLTIPEPRNFQGGKLPPGATEHEFNGMKYWSIPLKNGQ